MEYTVQNLTAMDLGDMSVRLTSAVCIRIAPTVKRTDGLQTTSVDAAQAVFEALRSIGDVTASIARLGEMLAKADHAYVLQITVNDEPVCSIKLVP